MKKPSYLNDTLRALKSKGFIAHEREFRQCLTTLRVIRTWAAYEGGMFFNRENVLRLTEKALKPYREGK